MGVLDEIKAITAPSWAWAWAELGNTVKLSLNSTQSQQLQEKLEYSQAQPQLNSISTKTTELGTTQACFSYYVVSRVLDGIVLEMFLSIGTTLIKTCHTLYYLLEQISLPNKIIKSTWLITRGSQPNYVEVILLLLLILLLWFIFFCSCS